MEHIDPGASSTGIKHRMARRIADINNSQIGILFNSKENAELLARETARFYEERHQCTLEDCFDKKQAMQACPTEHLQKLSAACNFLIISFGDSESCASCSLHDGISFEQYGKPALVVCTRPFEATAKNTASVLGLPDYPFALVDHPIGSSTPAEITERALSAYRQGMAILSGAYLIRG